MSPNIGKTVTNAWGASTTSRRMQCKKTWEVKLEKTVYFNDLNEINTRYETLLTAGNKFPMLAR